MKSKILKEEYNKFLIESFECSVIFVLSIIFTDIVLGGYGLTIGGFR